MSVSPIDGLEMHVLWLYMYGILGVYMSLHIPFKQLPASNTSRRAPN